MVKVKICGITRLTDALLASELGASAVGFIFWEKSPRYVKPETASVISAHLPPDVAPIGVFVDPSREWVCEVADAVRLAAVQLHGQESAAFGLDLPYRVIKAVSLENDSSIDVAVGLPDALTVLLDFPDPLKKGGTGRTVDWCAAATIASKRRIFLSGGLSPENVIDAVETVQPYAVDASSRLEIEPGIKDPDRLCLFFEALEQYSERSRRQREGKWERQTNV